MNRLQKVEYDVLWCSSCQLRFQLVDCRFDFSFLVDGQVDLFQDCGCSSHLLILSKVTGNHNQIEDINCLVTIDVSHHIVTILAKITGNHDQVEDINCFVTVDISC